MTQADRARAFAALHVKGTPLVLYNIWDAGSAAAVAEAGAAALATGSWSVAAAQGYPDGEEIPLEMLLRIAERIATHVPLPLTVDLEGGYADDPEELRHTMRGLILTGAIGLNFEDQKVGREGLFEPAEQAARIAALRASAEAVEMPIFINARTDLFLKEADPARHGALVAEALERADAYRAAGASGFFVPGLADPDLIARITSGTPLPVNVMMRAGVPGRARLADAGVARISYGPGPYRDMSAALTASARAAFA